MKKFLSILILSVLLVVSVVPTISHADYLGDVPTYNLNDYNVPFLTTDLAHFEHNYFTLTRHINANGGISYDLYVTNVRLDYYSPSLDYEYLGSEEEEYYCWSYSYQYNSDVDDYIWEYQDNSTEEAGALLNYDRIIWTSYDVFDNFDGSIVREVPKFSYGGKKFPSLSIDAFIDATSYYYITGDVDGYYLYVFDDYLYLDDDHYTNSSTVRCSSFVLDGEEGVWLYDGQTTYQPNSFHLYEDELFFSPDLDAPDEPDTPDEPEPELTECDGSSCPLVDANHDDICDVCGLPVTLSLRDDTYNFNGYYFSNTIEMADGSTTTFSSFFSDYKSKKGNLVILSDGDFEGSLLYAVVKSGSVSEPALDINGSSIVTTGNVLVTLFEATVSPSGTPYWKFSGTGEWKNYGSMLAGVYQVLWSADDITNSSSGDVAFGGDINFMSPLSETITEVMKETITKVTVPELVGTITTILLCGVGCLALVIGLVLLSKKLRTFLP